MVCVLVEGMRQSERNSVFRSRRAAVTRVSLPWAQTEYLLATLPPAMSDSAQRRCGRRLADQLRRAGVTGLLVSKQVTLTAPEAISRIPIELYGDLAKQRVERLFTLQMLSRAARLCEVPLGERRLAIVDDACTTVTEQQLLHAARLARDVTLVTQHTEQSESVLRSVFLQTGLAVRCTTARAIEAHVVLLLHCEEPVALRTRIALNLCDKAPTLIAGRSFDTVMLRLPDTAAPFLPPQLSRAESALLLLSLGGADLLQSLEIEALG